MEILSLVIACVVAYIAWQQHELSKERLKLDLFEKRYAVYEATKKFLDAVLSKGTCDYDTVGDFSVGVQDSRFLFGGGMVEYLDSLRLAGIDVAYNDGQASRTTGETKDKHLEKVEEKMKFLVEQTSSYAKEFESTLRFERWS